mgnify:FL=1
MDSSTDNTNNLESPDTLYSSTSVHNSEVSASVFNNFLGQNNTNVLTTPEEGEKAIDANNDFDSNLGTSAAAPENGGKIINVDNDFGGDLKSAIAASTTGDVVELGNKTYSASGITIDKDITINAKENSAIDISDSNSTDAVVPENGGKVINVDNDFGGDLKSAIASANSGDLVELGNKTYPASGVTIDQDNTTDNNQDSSEIDANNLVPNESAEQSNTAVTTTPENGGKVINVDNDFGGDLKSAIASANSGDVVELGNKTYSASGVTIDKDITLNGQEGTVIDGGGSSEPILNITQDADGATIQNIEITNANNGIYGNGATDLTLQNLDVNNIGISQPNKDGQNNTGITLGGADGFQILNSQISNIGRKGIGIGDTSGGTVSGVTVQGVNLDAQHAQNHDAAGVKFFNTTNVAIKDSNFSDINAHNIWNDTTTGTTIENNNIKDVGSDFIAPGFNTEVGNINGIYNEKSPNSQVNNNNVTAVDGFLAFNATKFTTETLSLGENNFSSQELGTTDYYVNEQAEKLVATTENPTEANFDLFAADYNSQLSSNT